jgi:DNA-binding XRE family transcriptional regulator
MKNNDVATLVSVNQNIAIELRNIGISTTDQLLDENNKPALYELNAKALSINPVELLPIPEQAKNKDFLDYFCPSDTWGGKIRKLRLSRNIQQKDLAEMVGIHKVSLCRYEKDRSKPSKRITENIDKILRTI